MCQRVVHLHTPCGHELTSVHLRPCGSVTCDQYGWDAAKKLSGYPPCPGEEPLVIPVDRSCGQRFCKVLRRAKEKRDGEERKEREKREKREKREQKEREEREKEERKEREKKEKKERKEREKREKKERKETWKNGGPKRQAEG